MGGFEISVIATFITTLILVLIYCYNTNRRADFTFTHTINAFSLFNYMVFSNYDTENIVNLATPLPPALRSVV